MNFKKVKVTQKPKQLTATWTVDLQPGEIEFSEVLEEELAKTLAEEIDWEIISDMLVMSGWFKVDLDRYNDRKHSVDISNWIEENCRGKHKNRGGRWLFESKEDAAWFILKWE